MVEAFNKDVPALASPAHLWRNAFDSPEQVARDGITFLRDVWSKY